MKIVVQKESIINGSGMRHHKNCKPVFCIDTGSVYTSVTDAAVQLGVTKSTISRKATQGKQFCFISEITEHLDDIADSCRKRESKLQEYNKRANYNSAFIEAQDEVAARKKDYAEARRKSIHANREYQQAAVKLRLAKEKLAQIKKGNN